MKENKLPKTNTKTKMPECKTPKNLKLWIVGQFLAETEKGRAWDIQGVFDSEEKAIKACKNETFFVGPVTLNDEFQLEHKEWEGAYYPKKS